MVGSVRWWRVNSWGRPRMAGELIDDLGDRAASAEQRERAPSDGVDPGFQCFDRSADAADLTAADVLLPHPVYARPASSHPSCVHKGGRHSIEEPMTRVDSQAASLQRSGADRPGATTTKPRASA